MKALLRFTSKKSWVSSLFAIVCATSYAATGDVVFSETFDTEDDFNKWTIVDNNGGRTWEYLNGKASYMLDYQTGLPADDWYISPEFTLAADRVYEFKFDLAIASRHENLKVCLGTSDEPSSFTTVIADFNDVVKADSGTKTYKIYVKADGNYRLGFYAYSEAQMHRIDVDNVSITDLSSVSVPGLPSDFTVAPADKGGMSATLSLVAPNVTANDQPLDGTCDINIYRNNDNAAVHTFSAVSAGQSLQWTDDAPGHGFNIYKVEAANAEGLGQSVEQTVFVGLDKPQPATNVVTKLNADKSVTLSWDAPTASVNGGYVDFDNIAYVIARGNDTIATQYMGNSYVDQVPVERGQALVSYTVTPVADTETGDAATSSSVMTGIPLTIPYAESFAGQHTDYPWYVDGNCNAFDWGMTFDDEDGEFEGVTTQDSDNGMMYASSRYADYGDESRLVSPLIDLNGAVNPVLKFWFYEGRSPWYDPEWEGEVNDRVQVQIAFEGGEWMDIDDAVFYQNNSTNGWTLCEVNLPKQQASFANIAFLATAEADESAYRNMYFDNITIDESDYANDLAMKSLTVDNKRVSVNEEQTYTATLLNRGGSAVADYTVEFYRDGNLVASVPGVSVEPANNVEVSYSVVATTADAQHDEFAWTAKVVFAADELEENNVSDTLLTSVRRSELPVVTGLAANGTLAAVSLSWNAASSVPAVEHSSMSAITDGFEDYEPFAIDAFGEWTVYDGDKAATLVSPRIPLRYEHQGEPMAFQVFNTEQSGTWCEDNYDDAFRPISDDSKQILICPSVDWPAENDDWLISPRLDGRAQTITFYAKSASYDSEWINVYTSTTDNHHDSFVKLNDDAQIYVPDGWWQFSYDVPEGTRYFAVRCVRRCIMLMMDNFTYAPYDGSCEAATLVGYNVYRDDVKLNAEPMESTTFIDTECQDISSVYTVTAVYDLGESDYSNEARLDATAIDAVKGAESATVIQRYTIDGKRIQAATRGVNIVRMADGKVRKVVVE